MILLDTNVLSEPLKPAYSQVVIDWLNAQRPETLGTTTLTLAELYAGVERKPDGKAKQQLNLELRGKLPLIIGDRVYTFDTAASECYARLTAETERKGRSLGTMDALIAAIALARGLPIATRDVQPFLDAGVRVINPWEYRP